MTQKIDDLTRNSQGRTLPEFEFLPKQQHVSEDRNSYQRRTTDSHTDTFEFRSFVQEVDKQMKDMEERINKQMGSMIEELNFKVLEVKLKQDSQLNTNKNLQKSAGPLQNQGLDPKKLENALNDWLQKVEV